MLFTQLLGKPKLTPDNGAGPRPLAAAPCPLHINFPLSKMKHRSMPLFAILLRNFRTEVTEKFLRTTDLTDGTDSKPEAN